MATLASIDARLRKLALGYPGAFEDHPWGEVVYKVGKKIFVFAGVREGTLHVTAKLPQTGGMALLLPFAAPTGYNLGKSGWVSAKFTRAKDVPVAMIEQWLDESYRALAPKTLVKELDARGGGTTSAASPRRPRRRAGRPSRPR